MSSQARLLTTSAIESFQIEIGAGLQYSTGCCDEGSRVNVRDAVSLGSHINTHCDTGHTAPRFAGMKVHLVVMEALIYCAVCLQSGN
jgi:hypothetical protein